MVCLLFLNFFFSLLVSFEDLLVVKRQKPCSVSDVELVLEFYPVQTQCVQKGREGLHNEQHRERTGSPHRPENENHDNVSTCDLSDDQTFPEHGTELGVGKGKRPQTEIRSCVTNGSKHELDCVNDLVDSNLAEFATFSVTNAEAFVIIILVVMVGMGQTSFVVLMVMLRALSAV